MAEQCRVRRRRYLAGIATAMACGVAGCAETGGSGVGGAGTDDDEGKPCVDAFRITEESVRFPNGSVPEVRLRLGNTGDGPIEYDLDVIFEQATSTGIYAKSGRDTLSGTIVAGRSVVVTATADGLDARSTDRYDVEVSLACPSR
jgi:hypothetical protein